MSKKHPILPNKFEIESKTGENAAKTAHLAAEIAPSDAQNARQAAQLDTPGAVLGAHSNAPKSKKRGPKTAEGKARSGRNAVKHGILTGPHPFIIEGLESREEWEAFMLGIVESWQPVGVQELELASNVAWDHWKLRRCRLYENAILSKQVEETEYELQQEDADEDDLPDGAPLPEIEPERLIHNQHAKVIPDGYSMDRILRYEAFVRKALGQDMHELEIQQARRGGIQALPARVVFSSDPSGAPPPRPPSNTAAIRLLNREISQKVTRAEGVLAERESAARPSGDAE